MYTHIFIYTYIHIYIYVTRDNSTRKPGLSPNYWMFDTSANSDLEQDVENGEKDMAQHIVYIFQFEAKLCHAIILKPKTTSCILNHQNSRYVAIISEGWVWTHVCPAAT